MIDRGALNRADGSLLSLEQAARMLGYTTKGLRKIVDRTRAKVSGARTRGATIRFFQVTKGAPIKFKPEWIEAFIDAHTIDPDVAVPPIETKGGKPPAGCDLLEL